MPRFSLQSSLTSRIQQLPASRQRQLLTAIIWLALVIFCAAGLAQVHSQQRTLAQARDRASAEAAARLLADQSLERLVSADRLSLQLLAQQLLALPAVSGVTLQDVESNPLAQAGRADRGETVTVPIVLHDSLAGSVSVNLLPGSDVHYPWAGLLLCLIFALPFSAACALMLSQLWRHQPASAPTATAPGPAAVALYLRPLNWTQLHNQLSASALDRLRAALAQRLQLLRRIYDGQPLANTGPAQGLGFSGADAAFRAVCCGLLLRELQRRNGTSGLQLAMAIMPAQSPQLDFDAERLLSQAQGLFLHSTLTADDSLADCVELHTANWGGEVTGLAARIQQLLDNQLQQLLNA